MIEHILVPIDGSDHADKALDLAIDLAGRYGAGLTLVHVLLRGSVPDEVRALSDRPGAAEPALMAELGIAAGDPVVGTVGNLRPVKDYPCLLRAFALARRRVPDAGFRDHRRR